MTNLPEAEIIRKSLEKEIVGKRFKDITVKSPSTVGRHRNRPEFSQLLEGRRIAAVARRGTAILLELDDDSSLVVSLGAVGSLSRETATAEAGPQTQAVLTFTTGGALHLVDSSKESELHVVAADEPAEEAHGIDPLAGTFTWHAFGQHLVARREPLGLLLRDDTFINGLGDVYSDEILWSAGIAVDRVSLTLSSQEIRRLYRALFEVLYEAIKQGGATEEGEPVPADADPLPPESAAHIRVHGRAGEPCPRCRRSISAGTLGDAAVFHCESCQT